MGSGLVEARHSPARRRKLAVVVAIALLSADGCGDSGGDGEVGRTTLPAASADTTVVGTEPAPTSTIPDATTSTAVTAEVPSTEATTVPPSPPSSSPPTTAAPEVTAAPEATEESLDAFGPLGSQPVLDLSFAGERAFDEGDISAVRIPGGVLVEQRRGSYEAPGPVTLTAIDADGSVRWHRSLPGVTIEPFVAPSSADPNVVLVFSYRGGPVDDDVEWLFLSLLDGSTVASLADLGAPAGLPLLTVSDRPTAGRRAVLLSIATGDGSLDPPAELYRVDLLTKSVDRIDLPAALRAAFPDFGWFEFDDRDDVVLVGPAPTPSAVMIHAVYLGERWSTDTADIDGRFDAQPVLESYGEGGSGTGLAVVDEFGAVLWSIPEFWRPGLEMTALSSDGVVVIAAVCEGEPAGELGPCTAASTVGVSMASGELLWRLPGLRMVSAGPADGVAIMNDAPFFDPLGGASDAPAWAMIDTTTGLPIEGQVWSDPAEFQIGCCAAPEMVIHDGGVVIAVGSRTIRVWYPDALSGATASVAVP